MPKVSVIMPLYNAEKHLQAALASVIAQTFTDYELIVIDDCSTDGTSAILATFDDPRIVRLRNDQNLGIVGALNRGLAIARGQYIARMDGDDLAYPTRFAAQVAYLDAHPEVGLLGTKYVHIDDQGAYVYDGVEAPPPPEPSTRGYLRWSLLWMTTIQHPTAMIRRAVIEQHGLRYDPAFFTAEDYELWARIGRVSVVERLPQVYLQYRVNPDGISITKRARQLETHYTITQRELAAFMGESLSEDLTRFLFRMVIPQHQDPAEVIRGVDVIAALRLFLQIRDRFMVRYPDLTGEERAHIRREVDRVLLRAIGYLRVSRDRRLRIGVRWLILRESPRTFMRLFAEFIQHRLIKIPSSRSR